MKKVFVLSLFAIGLCSCAVLYSALTITTVHAMDIKVDPIVITPNGDGTVRVELQDGNGNVKQLIASSADFKEAVDATKTGLSLIGIHRKISPLYPGGNGCGGTCVQAPAPPPKTLIQVLKSLFWA